MQETEIKYLAGLLDADGTLNYKIAHGYLYLRMSISASESIDKNHYIPSLANKFGIVYKREFSKEKPTWSDAYVWEVSRENDLNILLPRITKHMVIKGKIWREMYDTWLASKGKKINDILAELGSVAEGVKTSKAVCELAKKLGIEVPVSSAIYEAVYTDITPEELLSKLMNRKLKEEERYV